MALTVFRVRDGKLYADTVRVPRTSAVATAALGALDVGAPVTIGDGTAHVALARATGAQVAEIVYTLTQFAAIQRVDVAGRRGLTRRDLDAYIPPIMIDAPGAGARVQRTFHVTGTASVFEATFVVELRMSGNAVSKQTVTASEGAPGRGTFDTILQDPSSGAAEVVAYAPSAENGEPQHEVDVPVTVTP